jgi:hypothetical protein
MAAVKCEVKKPLYSVADPDWLLESGSRRAKMTHKTSKKLINVIFLNGWIFSFVV